VPKFGMKVPTLDATRTPVSRSSGQRTELEAGEGIPCRPNLATTLLVLMCKQLNDDNDELTMSLSQSWFAAEQ